MQRVLIFLFAFFATPALAADMAGSRDFPGLARVAGSQIIGYQSVAYDAGTFMRVEDERNVVFDAPEGKRTRILYLLESGTTPLAVQRNYSEALEELGAVREVYACANKQCNAHKLASTLWTPDTMIPTESLAHPRYLLGFSHNFHSPRYRYVKIDAEGATLHASIWAAELTDNNANKSLTGRTVALVELVEVEAFESSLELVEAAQMREALADTGHVALYGIQFDSNSATLKPESDASLAEIVKAMGADAGLSVYVVGHTDDVGELAYNQTLSDKRARAVVSALTAAGVDGERLTAVGVGPVAPVASNETESGRALNRRVELVGRLDGG